MLVSAELTSTLTVESLIGLWANRYKSHVPIHLQNSLILESLIKTASPEGRNETVGKLHRLLIKLNCGFSVTQTYEVYKYSSDTADPGEVKRIVQCAVEIYSTVLEFYKQAAQNPSGLLQSGDGDRKSLSTGLGTSDIVQLSNLLDPLLLEYQERHQISDDWSKLGFLTTHINFSNVALLSNLTPIEQTFIKPYFKFLEEQVALPWQRVCAAANSHQFSSPAFQLVKHLMPSAEDIAYRVYMSLLRHFSKTTMRRGRLDHPGIRHSCLRDLNMFQAYLWLCVLQGSLDPVEDELVRLCTMVMPRVGVPWEMTVQWNNILMQEVMDRTMLSQQAFLEPYATGFMQAFKQSKEQFMEQI
jgi:Phycobilisome protein